jgi:exosortase A
MNTVPNPEHPAAAPQPASLAGANPALLVALVMLLPLLLYFGTARSLVDIWRRSDTFAHGFIILPISLWLVWRQRAALRALPLQPFWPALLALAACGAAWLLASLAGVGIVRQYALAAMLPLTVLAILGKRITLALLFPLAFILFAVPVGEGLIPPLIDLTANFTIDALRLSGIPVLRDGNSFSIPSGNWSVVEACSGLRYLVSSVTLGCLFAYLSYRSAWRRGLFVLAAVLVPLAANGMRAYMIVMMGHLSGMTLAVGVDHLIYGWVFFGIVMLLLFWVGSFWREDLDEAGAGAAAAAPAPALPLRRLQGAAVAVLAVLGLWPAVAAQLEARTGAPMPVPAPIALAAPAAPAFTDWQPDFAPASAALRQFHAGRQPVGVTVLYYGDEAGGNKLVSSTNRFGQDRTPDRENAVASRQEQVAGAPLAVREALLGVPGRRLLVWQWYVVGGKMTSNNYVGKLLQAKEKMLTGSGAGAAVMVFCAYEEDPAVARAVLRDFLDTNLAPLHAAVARNSRTQP